MSPDVLLPGQEVARQSFPVQRINLVMYAGASGDFNPIHWNESFARSVGLPDVIAHGMFTMAEAMRAVTDWVGDPGLVRACDARFTRPVPVPDDGQGARVEVVVVVREVHSNDEVSLDIRATCAGSTVLEGDCRVGVPKGPAADD